MGCDGGSIPKRHELVKTRARSPKPEKSSQIDAKWTCCAISKEPLKQPIVACRLGRLYNKDKVIEFLLNRKNFGDGDIMSSHITGMKDVITLNLTPNPALDETSRSSAIMGSSSDKPRIASFVCPISMKEMNGKNRFCFIASCGCVLSEQAMKEVPSKTCLRCNKPFTEGDESDDSNDIIPLHTEVVAEQEKLRARMERLKAAQDLAKKQAKAAKKGKPVDGSVAVAAGEPASKKRKEMMSSGNGAAVAAAKKQALAGSASATSNINIPLPKILNEGKSVMERSAAIKSLYAKDPTKSKGNYLTMGTFTRYASF
ncbi:hypothetical protein HK101_011496 [Irineochytrium annulatum]|nr:hypothetical protein HK101_011496 [Irineochytrium annulatum]